MTVSMILKRMKSLAPQNELEEENAMKEAFHECVLCALSESGLFEKAAFLGGTSLRILHGLERFSEDIDLALLTPDATFRFAPFVNPIFELLKEMGVKVTIKDKSEIEAKTLKRMIVKDSSLVHFLEFRPAYYKDKSLTVKIEVDSNPPPGACTKLHYLNFPGPFSVQAYDLESCFAGKIHAILCRGFDKGRDWYDLLWYFRFKIQPNYAFLKAALFQQGPWSNQNLQIDVEWLRISLEEKAQSINWRQLTNDVAPFVRPRNLKELQLWHSDFFISQIRSTFKY